jgi:hypothetical protein
MPQVLTKTVTAYKFSELSPPARARALESFRDINTDYKWYEPVYENMQAIGAILGIEIDKMYFSGFSSQGDGACFEGSFRYEKDCVKKIMEYAPRNVYVHAIARNIAAIQKRYFYGITGRVKHSGHYYHNFCTDFSFNNVYPTDIPLSSEDEKSYISEIRDLMQWFYRQLEVQYDYLTSDEAVIESIESNDYDFTIEGNFPAI